MDKIWNGTLETALIVLVIFVAVVANLGSEASKIALEKDWIVVLSGGNQEKLSSKTIYLPPFTRRNLTIPSLLLLPCFMQQRLVMCNIYIVLLY